MVTDLFYGLLPEHLLLAQLLLMMLLEIVGVGKRASGVCFVLVAGAGCALLLSQISRGYSATIVPGEIVVDPFALSARLVILACGLVYGISCLKDNDSPKFWMLLTSSLLGASILMVSKSFLTLFLAIELLSLPAFALMVQRSGAAVAAEGAFKYLLLSATASALILFGISFAYGSTGSLEIAPFVESISAGDFLIPSASSLILCGLFLKAAVFPFHAWAPDAYSGAKLEVTAFLASVVKAAVVLGLVRIFGTAPLSSKLTDVVAVLGVVSILYGNISAVRQSSFKRLLAYSSVAHAGYMILAFSTSVGNRSETLLYYLSVYALTTIVACSCFAMLTRADTDDLESLDGAFSRHPLPASMLALALLSMAGIPPLPGFFAKFLVFKPVISSGYLWPAVLAFSGSVIGATYYLGIVGRLFKSVAFEPEVMNRNRHGTRLCGVILGAVVLLLLVVSPEVIFFL